MADSDKTPLKVPQVLPEGSLRDFVLPIVEFLGILVPGLLFLLLALPALAVPITYVLTFIITGHSDALNSFEYIVELLKASSVGVAGVVLVASYVAGHIFYRQDPKIPDEHSFNRVKDTIRETGPVRICPAEIEDNEKKNITPINRYNLEFPYRYLKEYLTERGMHHLALLVHWRGLDPRTYAFRTKHFINGLKARLEFVFPYQYVRIQRNEAHVRLMSSLWYATRSLQVLCIFGGGLGFLFAGIVHSLSDTWWPVPEVHAFSAPLLVALVASVVRTQIEEFLHYQRIREIVFILELVYFSSQQIPDMFVGIIGARESDP